MPHALLLTLLFATSVAAAPADKTLARRVRDEDAQDRTLKMAVLSGAVASKLLSLKEHHIHFRPLVYTPLRVGHIHARESFLTLEDHV